MPQPIAAPTTTPATNSEERRKPRAMADALAAPSSLPPGWSVPIFVLPVVVFIEIFSFLLRPISHSVRLFANMLAGHIALKVFAGFVALLGVSLGAVGWIGGIAPLALTIAIYALEILVAFLQAYVFAILTCIYLNDAIHPGH